jgi:4-diphosphocytidyl-2-C-methyl-D-erythritol kinase
MPVARVRAFAKINLSLEVLNKRPDGFHNLRTIFQTISLADTIDIQADRSRRTLINLESDVEIPGENLIVRAALAVLEESGVRARVHFRLRKRIPMGGGLGGGSTDAAAVLLALPSLLKRPIHSGRLIEIGSRLGSDVPFFLIGGTALGLGRGTELYPLADAPAFPALLVAPAVHVSTAEAYRLLQRTAVAPEHVNHTERLALALAAKLEPRLWGCSNDFEVPVLAMHAEIAAAKRKLLRAGAQVAMMTGSGAAVFGLFASKEQRDTAAAKFSTVYRISLVSRARYHKGEAPWVTSSPPSNVL